REESAPALAPPAALRPDRHRECRRARHECHGAVQWIYDPAPLGPGGHRPALLPEESDSRESATEAPPDLALRCPIRARHGISRALELDGPHSPESVIQDSAGGPGRGDGRPRLGSKCHATSGRLIAWKILWRSSTSPRASSGVVIGRLPVRTHSAKWSSSSLNASLSDAVTRFSTACPFSIDSTT